MTFGGGSGPYHKDDLYEQIVRRHNLKDGALGYGALHEDGFHPGRVLDPATDAHSHATHLNAHAELRAFMREDLLIRYQRAPRWRRWLIDRLLAK